MAFRYAGVHASSLKSTELFSEWVHNFSFCKALIPVVSMHALCHCYKDIVSDVLVQVIVLDAAQGFDGAVFVDDSAFPKHMISTVHKFSTVFAFAT